MKIKILSVVRVPDNEGDELGYPGFLVKGEADGAPFEREINLEFDGRDADDRHVSGVDLALDPDYDASEDIFLPVYETDAYKAAYAEYLAAPVPA